jgi:hypothetical protein
MWLENRSSICASIDFDWELATNHALGGPKLEPGLALALGIHTHYHISIKSRRPLIAGEKLAGGKA